MAASDDLLDQAASLRANKSPNMVEQAQPSDALLDGIATERKRRTDAVLDVVTKMNPDKAAEAKRLSAQFGLDPATVEQSQDELARLARIKETQELLTASPFLARQMHDPAFAAIAQDDVQVLGDMERVIQGVKNTGKAALAGIYGASAGVVGVAQAPFEVAAPLMDPLAGTILPENPLRRVAGGLSDYRKGIDATAKGYQVRGDGNLEQGWYSGIGSLARNLAALPLAFFPGGQAAALTGMTAPVFGEEYGKTRDKGIAPGQAATYGASQAAIEYATEKLPMSKLIGDIKAGTKFLPMLGKQVALEVPGEQIATVLQDLNEWAVINPDKPFADYLKERPDAAVQTLVATLVGVGGQTTVVKGIDMAMAQVDGRAEAARNAEQRAQLVEDLNKLASASTTVSRDAAAVEQFIAQATEDGPVQNLYIDGKTLMQSGMAEQLAAVSPSVAEQIGEAVATGGEVRIPIAEYTARIAGTEYGQALVEDIRIEGEDFTRRQAQEYLQSGAVQELQQMVEQTITAQEGDAEFKSSQERVKTMVLEQLNTLNRFTAQKNEVDATLIAARSAVRAAQLGMTPEQFFEKQLLKVQADGVVGEGVLNQGDTVFDWSKPGGGSREVKVGDSRIIYGYDGKSAHLISLRTPSAKRNNGSARAAIEQFLRETDALGIPVKLESSPLDKRTKDARLFNFYKSLGFEPTGKRINAAGDPEMVRQPQQLAQSAVPPASSFTADTIEVDGVTRPATNSNGQRIAQTEEGLRNFWRWFGDSKVVDESGKPLVVYHGTSADITEFDPNRANYFTASKVAAGYYAEGFGEKRSGNVMPVYLSIKNPKILPLTDSARLTTADIDRYRVEGYDGVFGTQSAYMAEGRPSIAVTPDGRYVTEGIPFSPTQIKSATGNRGTFDPVNPNILMQSAFHGSPYKFDKFSLEHLGKGEGAQAYGWGLYFAGKKEVAEHYRQVLSGRAEIDVIASSSLRRSIDAEEKAAIFNAASSDSSVATAGQKLQYQKASLQDIDVDDLRAVIAKVRKAMQGQLYEVEIPEDDTMLLWDKPLSEQPEGVNKAVQKVERDRLIQITKQKINARAERVKNGENTDAIDRQIEVLREEIDAFNLPLGGTGERYYKSLSQKLGGDREASKYLNSLGIAGIKYLDGTSRSAGDGSYNYVIFDDSAVEILNTYYQNKNSPRGAFNPATNTLTLLKNADLSTFLHEAGHYFFENDIALAAELANKPDLTEGERQILTDVSTLLTWHGINGDINAQLAQWYGMGFEERRAYHERTAESFEAYLFEGKAPSIELQGYFQKFRAWMMNVYRSLKDFLTRNPEAGKLNDEVRQVFDRMLATNEQIALAEQARSMLPLFTSPDQAGMTVEEFATYQALGIEATADAIQDVQARTLRDLAWTRNARGREIKRLQKEAKARRDEVQMEVRREVMSQPVYRAWQFLTGKLTADDKLPKLERPKSSPNSVDESQDSLFVAIAKLGGIRRDQLESQWGMDPKEKVAQPVFGKPVIRREGGHSIDGMAELLSQYGYLTLDENGKWDNREFEEVFNAELGGSPQYSNAVDPAIFQDRRPGEQVRNIDALAYGRFDLAGLNDLGLPDEIIEHVKNLKMTAKDGIHPDIVAEMFGFSSGDELVRTLAAAEAPKVEIEGRTDQAMLERYGELATPEAIERAADKAIHNDARARFVATEANALAKATGQPKILAQAAREFARAMIARLKVRDIRPSQYAQAEVRAAKAAAVASQSGDLDTAAAEKRNQLVQNYATRAAYDAQEETEKGLRYLRKFDKDIKNLDPDYADQIHALLERFELRKLSLKAIDKRTALAEWIEAQREQGLEPDIPDALKNEAFRKSFKDMTVEEFRGLVDTVKQIEHLGRLKNKLLTARDQRSFEAVKAEIVASINENAGDRTADTRTPTTNLGRAAQQLKRFWASHIKAATWARVLDGGKDGGPMWEYFIRNANERGDMETQMRAEATEKLTAILAPVFKLGKMGGKGQYFASINRSLNREARIALALNIGNEGNLQRLLGGEGWTEAQITPVLQSLTADELNAVQAVWDHFESYRPQIGAKERRVYGKEPQWVEPGTRLAAALGLRGGYYPIKYDPAASQRAEEYADAEDAKRQLQGAFTTATTRRSFTKSRTEEVQGRPLLYTLAGLYSGVNDVIHDLAWHEWLIDANRLLRSKSIDNAIRSHYGPEAKAQFKTWAADVAEGEKAAQNAAETALGKLRQGISAAGLGFNVMSAAIQITGFNQSIVRVGARWIGRGITRYIGNPVGTAREVVEKSSFMADRSRTLFRELNELRNRVQDETAAMRTVRLGTYYMMMRVQKMVDVPTWLGAYEKAIAGGNDESRAVALADQAVIDSQGSGMMKDLAAIERGHPAVKIFTVFYSYMNTAFNRGVERVMTEKSKGKLAADMLLLYTVPAILGKALKDALTPGGDDEDDLEALARSLAAEQLSYLMGTMVIVREFAEVAKIITGTEGARDYQGPAGIRAISDALKFATQASQGEFDDAFRKSAINLIGDLSGLPAAQINRSWTGTEAFIEGETDNPAAILFGYQSQ